MAEAQGDAAPRAYFDTPERAERLQLVAHLIRNVDTIPYIRGPEGAGKSRFAERLAAIFRQEGRLVLLDGKALTDVPTTVCSALGIAVERWPVAAIDAAAEKGLMIMVDDIDHATETVLRSLQDLWAAGARLVFLGSGDPASLPGDWRLQVIDLPPFSRQQLGDFLDFLGHPESLRLKEAELARLHRECKGQPGGLIAALAAAAQPETGVSTGHRQSSWRLALGGGAAILVVLALWQQDRINALFEPQTEPPAISQPAPAIRSVVEKQPAEPAEVPAEVADSGPVAEPEAEDVGAGEPGPRPAPVLPEVEDTAEVPELAGQLPGAPSVSRSVPVEQPADAPSEAAATGPEAAAEPPSPVAPTAAEPEPAPAETKVEPAPEAEPVAVAPVESEPSAVEMPTGPRGLDWLRSRKADAFTLQLVGARERAAIAVFIKQHDLSGDYMVYERDLAGKPWFSLVYGDYPDRDAALEARASLPGPLHKAWPRTFESIWQQLPPPAATD